MDPIIEYVIISLGFVLLLLVWMKLAELGRKSTDFAPSWIRCRFTKRPRIAR